MFKALMITVVVLYSLAMIFILIYSFTQGHLLWNYVRDKKKRKASNGSKGSLQEYPNVTVQLPVYNELYVVERLINAVAVMDYPTEKLEIQVLDDSNDDTVEIIANKVSEWQAKGVDIQHVRRPERVGFKAGALKYGLEKAKGEYVAVFDADFIPDPDFLQKTLPHFDDNKVGMVQTKWKHINKDYSLLTHMQAFALDAHFTIEQAGRNNLGAFMNFNGTAGVWRRTCIEDAGNWEHDTLTEDLDLSYRAQMKGWKFKYLEDVTSPSELPPIISALKSQQYRWTKGGAETARKHLWGILKSDLPFKIKWHAMMHLLNTGVFLCILTTALLSVPMIIFKSYWTEHKAAFDAGYIFLTGFLVISALYFVSSSQDFSNKLKSVWYYIRNFPLFLGASMGMSLHNGLAVFEGYIGRKSPFVRTPKFNVNKKSDSCEGNKYVAKSISFMTVLEGLMAVYFSYGLYLAITFQDYGMVPFMALLTFGFLMIFYWGISHMRFAAQ